MVIYIQPEILHSLIINNHQQKEGITMRKIRNYAIILFTASAVFIGCFNEPDVSEISGPAENNPMLSKITLPIGATLDSAVFSVNVTGDNSLSNLAIHRITSGWTEAGVTWNTQPSFDPAASAVFPSTIVDGSGWYNVDVTNLVQYWLNNPLDNFGLLLKQDNQVVRLYHSSEFILNPALYPKLTVYFNGNQSFTIQRGSLGTVADTWIWSLTPDQNYGTDIYLHTINIPAENYIKYALFQFDYEVIVINGCSFSMGYWFAKPNLVWGTNVTVGGFTYTQDQGKAIWNTSNRGGMKDSKLGFLQVAAIKLSGTVLPSASVWQDVAIVETWLATLGKLSASNLPTGNQSVKAAAGRIGDWIDANHCE